MKKKNYDEVYLLLKLFELRRDPEMRKARIWYLHKFNPKSYGAVKKDFFSGKDEDRWLRMVVSYWNLVTLLVSKGYISEGLFFNHTTEDVRVFQKIYPFVEEFRKDFGEGYFRFYETIFKKHLKWIERDNAKWTKEKKTSRNK